METIKKFYELFEEKFSTILRVGMVIAMLVVLLTALYYVMLGAIKANKEATLETDIAGLEYSVAKEVLFNKQQELVEEEDVDDNEEEDTNVVVDPRIIQIYKSIGMHFRDENANKDQFKDKDRGLSAESLQDVINVYSSGFYKIGSFARATSSRILMPENSNNCSYNSTIPSFNEDQKNQLINQMKTFWKNAETGAADNKSKFNTIKRFDLRLGTVYLANDLFLCEFKKNYSELSSINSKIQNEVASENMEGNIMSAGALVLLDTMFKFFAAFAIVVLALILVRIERSLRK